MSTITALSPPTWRDGKRYAWLLGVFVPTLPFIVYGLVHLTGWPVFWFCGPFLIFGVFPPLDLIIGMDAENPPDSVLKWLEQDRYYRWCTYAFLPLQPERVGDDRRLVCWPDRGVRRRRAAIPRDPDGGWLPAARGRQLPRALRAAAPEAARRAIRADAA